MYKTTYFSPAEGLKRTSSLNHHDIDINLRLFTPNPVVTANFVPNAPSNLANQLEFAANSTRGTIESDSDWFGHGEPLRPDQAETPRLECCFARTHVKKV